MHVVRTRLLALLALLWSGLLAIPTLLIMLPLLPWRGLRVKVGSWYARAVAWGSLKIFGIRPVYEGIDQLEDTFPAIYLANHSSNIDPFLAIWHCPIGAVGIAKREITRIPFFGWAYYLSGHLLIDRSDRTSTLERMAATAKLVKDLDLGLYVWPEGTMPNDGRILPFRKGFVHLAIATGLPVVPIVIHDAHLLWPARTLDFRPGTLRIEVLEPIATNTWTSDRAGDIAQEVRQRFIERLGEHQHPLPEQT
jgi:lysophosphatidate acyltransferase